MSVAGRHRTRLARLESVLRAKVPPTPVTFDPTHLTPAEETEWAMLAARLRRLPDGRWDFTGLDDAALDRLTVLVGKGEGRAGEINDA